MPLQPAGNPFSLDSHLDATSQECIRMEIEQKWRSTWVEVSIALLKLGFQPRLRIHMTKKTESSRVVSNEQVRDRSWCFLGKATD